METPEFVIIGHVVRDLMADGWRMGGTATFASVQARRLGLRVGVVTRVGADMSLDERLPGVAVTGRPSEHTTSFENVYDGAARRQRVTVEAEGLALEDIPPTWRSVSIALLGPVCAELGVGLGTEFTGSLVGASAQGWLREIDGEGWVQRRVWKGAPFWSGCRVLFVSEEDLGGEGGELARWEQEVPVVVETRDRRGARVWAEGRWRSIDAFPANEVDPTGAGDVFATAFLVRYHETEDAGESARFASAAAACCVEGAGSEAIVGRREIEARMKAHKEVKLR